MWKNTDERFLVVMVTGMTDENGWQEIHQVRDTHTHTHSYIAVLLISSHLLCVCVCVQACRFGNVQHLEHLLFYGADMSSQNASGNTALHLCALYNQVTHNTSCFSSASSSVETQRIRSSWKTSSSSTFLKNKHGALPPAGQLYLGTTLSKEKIRAHSSLFWSGTSTCWIRVWLKWRDRFTHKYLRHIHNKYFNKKCNTLLNWRFKERVNQWICAQHLQLMSCCWLLHRLRPQFL